MSDPDWRPGMEVRLYPDLDYERRYPELVGDKGLFLTDENGENPRPFLQADVAVPDYGKRTAIVRQDGTLAFAVEVSRRCAARRRRNR